MMQSVQVIIERLKSHPEDFFVSLDSTGFGHSSPKFRDITERLDDLLSHKQEGFIHRLWFLNDDEKEALLDAYKEARRARFEAQVFHTLLTAPTAVDLAVERMTPSGKRLMQGAMWGGAVPSSAVTTQSMMEQTTTILSAEFDKQYAKNRNT